MVCTRCCVVVPDSEWYWVGMMAPDSGIDGGDGASGDGGDGASGDGGNGVSGAGRSVGDDINTRL